MFFRRIRLPFESIREKMHNKFELRKVPVKGKNNYVFGHVDFIKHNLIQIGDYCRFNHGAYLNGANHIHIGNDVTISAGAKLLSTGLNYQSWANGNREHISGGGITVGDHVWIGANAIILNNVKVSGQYVVIAAGAVVTKDIAEDRYIVAGCPAKIIKKF